MDYNIYHFFWILCLWQAGRLSLDLAPPNFVRDRQGRRCNLHLYCRAFGIHSSKAGGITGDDVGSLFKDKQYKEIAEYNSWDLVATDELYEIWQEYINF